MLRDAVVSLRERAAALQAGFARAPTRIAARNAVLAGILEARIAPRLERIGRRLGMAGAGAAHRGAPSSETYSHAPDGRTAERAAEQLRETDLHLHVMEHLMAWRADPTLGAALEDADTIARAMLRPLQDLARHDGLPFPQLDVVCAPAAPEEESVWFGLLPPGHPVVFVPEDFEQDIHRWVSVPHEIGHVMWRELPGFANEVRGRLGLARPAPLMQRESEGYVFDRDAPFAAWLEEMHCDGITALMMGPTALRGMVRYFKNPEEPAHALWAAPSERGTYGTHPPAHLRVHTIASLLEIVGFDAEAKKLVREWDTLHGEPEVLLLPTRDGAIVRVPAQPVIERGRAYIEQWYQGGYASLLGRDLRDVHGLEMSPSMWAQVDRASRELLAGPTSVRDARLVLAAAIEAVESRPSARDQIARQMLASILSPGERRGAVATRGEPTRPPRHATARGSAVLGPDTLADAIVFGEILARPQRGVLPVHRIARALPR